MHLYILLLVWKKKNERFEKNNEEYEEHILFVSNQIYYWIYKCTTCHYYTNIIKTI
jgi:hypothetical protein